MKTAAELNAEALSRIKEVSPQQVLEMQQRGDADHAARRARSSRSQPREDSRRRSTSRAATSRSKIEAVIPRDAHVIIYCASGNRSVYRGGHAARDGLHGRGVDGRWISRLGRGRRRRRLNRDAARHAARSTGRRAPRAAPCRASGASRSRPRDSQRYAAIALVLRSSGGGEPELLMIKRAEMEQRSVERTHRVSRRTDGSRRPRSRAHRDSRDVGRDGHRSRARRSHARHARRHQSAHTDASAARSFVRSSPW